MNAKELRGRIPAVCNKLSVLRQAGPGCITYYVGNDVGHLAHLASPGGSGVADPCAVLVHEGFTPTIEGVLPVPVPNPQLGFYRLSSLFKRSYLDYDAMALCGGAHVHPGALIPESCVIGPGAVIGECVLEEGVRIEAGCVLYSGTRVGQGTLVEPNTVLGATGMMWVWDGPEKVHLEQLGNVEIGAQCVIGSNVTIVRGSANETTRVGAGTCMAHGTMIGHGCQIGEHNHFANNVSFGGGVEVGDGCFFGCASTVAPGKRVSHGVVLGAGALLTKDAGESGIWMGVPARRTGAARESMAGVPRWTPDSGRPGNAHSAESKETP